ncbi:MAG: PD40 domain-containing protein [Candidatus Riflebacteria bacterium]|nr:PD40 domain-containing protein [Candidatus Riflebacteria bacterium]
MLYNCKEVKEFSFCQTEGRFAHPRIKFSELLFVLILSTLFFNLSAFCSPPQGRILFIDTSKTAKTSLAVIKPDGSGKKNISPEFENIMFPQTVEKMGMIGVTNRRYNLRSEIFFVMPNQKKIRKVTNGAVFHDFSTNGNFVLFTPSDNKSPLMVYSFKKHAFIKLSDRKITSARWSPKGDWIITSALLPDGSSDLFLISTKAQGVVRLTKTPGVNESFPVFANDGKHIAYITDKYGRSEIELMNIETHVSKRPLIVGAYPSFSPDNQWICFESGSEIMISRVNGLDQKVLCHGRTPIWIK